MASRTHRPGLGERLRVWLVWDGDALDPGAVGVSAGLVISAVGYLVATRAGGVLAVGLIVLGGVVVTGGLTYGLVRGGWGPGHRAAGPVLARLETLRRQRDEARDHARSLRRELAEVRGEEVRPGERPRGGDGSEPLRRE